MDAPRGNSKYCNSPVWVVLEEMFPSRFKNWTHGFQLIIIRTPLNQCIYATGIQIST